MSTLLLRSASVTALLVVACGGCKSAPAELEPINKDQGGSTTTTPSSSNGSSGSNTVAATAPTPPPPTPPPGSGNDDGDNKDKDPQNGSFTLADATKDLKGSGAIVATIDTSKGAIVCKLLDDKAPITVANFIGLATGKRAFRDPKGGAWVNRPWYDGTTFHRVIKGFMIQGGDPKGNGSGEPGYEIKDELWAGGKHDRAGLLCMANHGANTNGGQFFITDDSAPHLDKSYTIFGDCAPLDVIHAIANTPVMGERPAQEIKIKTVKISRDDKKK